MRILVDMNLSPARAGYLEEQGFEAVHWSEIGSGDAPDAVIMSWAAERGYLVMTADLDFGAILAVTQRRLPSVVQLRSDVLTPHAIGESVLTAIRQAREELLEGALVSVDPGRSRLRILPLKD